MLKIVDNLDTELMEIAEAQLAANKEEYGERYCPCALEHSQKWVCPCEQFRNQESEGECHCGRYMKISV